MSDLIISACCYQSGEIEFIATGAGAMVPQGALVIAKGPENRLREIISAVARHAYHGKTLLVPGVPEASSADAAIDALIDFRGRVERRLNANEPNAKTQAAINAARSGDVECFDSVPALMADLNDEGAGI